MLVKNILEAKGAKVWSVPSGKTLKEALKILVENKIGVVLVLDRTEQVVGILSERDIMRECYKNPRTWDNSPVTQVMTPCVIMVNPDTSLDHVMQLMTENRIRHIPVMKKDELVGIVSIGDVVKARLKDTEHEVEYMKDYLKSS